MVSSESKGRRTHIITGPTSGIGRCTALELAKHGTVVLVGRDPSKLNNLQSTITGNGGQAVSVVCELSDLASVERAASENIALKLSIRDFLNNAGIMAMRAAKNAQGWDMVYATNHLGRFALTEALIPHLPDGANVVFIASRVEDLERKPARVAGFRGARFISVAASAWGEWKPDGSKLPGGDAYATSKQCNLATVLAFARAYPRLHFNAVEPGFCPATGLGREANIFLQLLAKYMLGPLAPLIKYWSTPKRASRVITKVLLNETGSTGLLRRGWEADERLKAGARLEVPGSHRGREEGLVGNGCCLTADGSAG